MLDMIIRILCGAVIGFCLGYAARAWVKEILSRRELEYALLPKAEKLLFAAATVLGGIVGSLTETVPAMLCGLILLLVCLVLSVTDSTHRIIPNPAVLATLVLKLAFGIPALLGAPGFPQFNILQSLIGFAVCFVIFALPGMFKKNVGAGDLKLAAAMGFFLGIYYALAAIVIMGLLVVLYSLVQRKMPVLTFFRSYIPMGPFIALGMLAAYLLGPRYLIL